MTDALEGRPSSSSSVRDWMSLSIASSELRGVRRVDGQPRQVDPEAVARRRQVEETFQKEQLEAMKELPAGTAFLPFDSRRVGVWAPQRAAYQPNKLPQPSAAQGGQHNGSAHSAGGLLDVPPAPPATGMHWERAMIRDEMRRSGLPEPELPGFGTTVVRDNGTSTTLF